MSNFTHIKIKGTNTGSYFFVQPIKESESWPKLIQYEDGTGAIIHREKWKKEARELKKKNNEPQFNLDDFKDKNFLNYPYHTLLKKFSGRTLLTYREICLLSPQLFFCHEKIDILFNADFLTTSEIRLFACNWVENLLKDRQEQGEKDESYLWKAIQISKGYAIGETTEKALIEARKGIKKIIDLYPPITSETIQNTTPLKLQIIRTKATAERVMCAVMLPGEEKIMALAFPISEARLLEVMTFLDKKYNREYP